jgi:pimeloyl-ACP methyl ester carboxylesterase
MWVYDAAGITFKQAGDSAAAFHPTDGPGLQRLYSLLEPHAKPLPEFVLRDVLRHSGDVQWVVDREMKSMETRKDALDGRLGALTEPVLLVWGSDDLLIPVAVAQQMHEENPRSELDVIEGCGHLAPKSCPARVAIATSDFLKTNPAPSGGVHTLQRVR